MDAFRPDYPYPHFDAYEADVLQERSTLEQLLTMDSELANYIHLSKYIGLLHPAVSRFCGLSIRNDSNNSFTIDWTASSLIRQSALIPIPASSASFGK